MRQSATSNRWIFLEANLFGENAKRHPRDSPAMRGTSAGIFAAALVLAGCVGAADPERINPDGATDAPEPRGDASPVERTRKADTPHVHDYWFGDTSIVLLDESVPVMVAHNHAFDEPPREQHTHGCDETLASDSQGGSRKFSLPPGKIVLPGTEALEFFFTWNAPSITGLKLLYRPANGHDFVDAGALTQSQILRVALSPEMADAGHTTQTKWAFFLCADSDKPLDVAEGAVRTNLLAIRAAELPLEPPHPDAWNEGLALVIAEARFSNTTVAALNKGESAWFHIPIEHGVTIPPGTGKLRILVNVTPDGGSKTIRPDNLLAYHRDPSVPEWVYRIANATTSTEAGIAIEIPVDHDMADGVYAHETNWDLWLRVASGTRVQTTAGLMSVPFTFSGTIEARVVAIREASPETDA